MNHLLYQAMRQQRADLPIPWEAAAGYSNCGRGFFSAVRSRDTLALTEVTYPPYLVVNGQWTRKPESDKEQLYHFVFHLRKTMWYLTHHPVGKASAPSPQVVGQQLTQLPKRAAYVSGGNDAGVIYTLDTPEHVTYEAQAARTTFIRKQTRQTYCHPKAEVEAALRPAPPVSVAADVLPWSRWNKD